MGSHLAHELLSLSNTGISAWCIVMPVVLVLAIVASRYLDKWPAN